MTEFDREQHDHFLRLFMGLEESLRVFVRSLLFTHDEEREVMQEVAVVLRTLQRPEQQGPKRRAHALPPVPTEPVDPALEQEVMRRMAKAGAWRK